ncbi:hypothetical protein DUI87_06472 [Hirundo rustica rustica]|uniref:SH3 domain-containing protein n=1 Tax=Hirundo rustica rustica TaxID=333673 RepID=A0A3M0KTR5_HIRRU|nr:hypothetical protein DUI87_06472 [Hirundo rustica rustica]
MPASQVALPVATDRKMLEPKQTPPEVLFKPVMSCQQGHGGGTDSKPVVRYSKDQRPTTLPIQPFVFQHHFSKPPKARALHSHFASSLSQLYSLSSSRPASQQISSSQSSAWAASAEQALGAGSQAHGTLVTQRSADGAASRSDGGIKKPGPETTRPSPLGSYSPVRCNVPFFQSVDSSSSPTAERAEDSQPPRSRSCPISANLLPTRSSPAVSAMQPSKATKADTLRQKENPKLIPKKEALLEPSPPLSEYRLHSGSLPPLSVGGMSMSRVGGHADSHWRSGSETNSSGPLSSMGIRPINANHLSPQALKWREYRRRNPLGLDRVSGLPSLAGSLDRRQQEPRLNRGNPIFELPGALSTSHFHCKLNGQSVRQLQLTYNDFFPDYFSLAEKPPAEFCLSPDGNTESISIDLLQKKGLVKAINTAVDLIVAHFGTSRDPGVKAKLGNSSVSPNVGHLILKYLCPAVRDILSDGLKAYVLDMIIGQRRNIPWSVVEASTQLGPSTKLLHSLYSKISQYTELTNHTMRFNAFIFGLLNIRSLEFWFNHLYNHEADADPGSSEDPDGCSTAPETCHGGARDGDASPGHSPQQAVSEKRVKGVGASCGEGDREEEQSKMRESAWEGKKDKQAGWWYQLMQTSQIYIESSAEGSKFIRSEKKKAALNPAPRLPSGWLSLDKSVFQLVAQTVGASMWREAAQSQTLLIQNHLRHLLWHDQPKGCLLTLLVCLAPFIVMDQRMVWGSDAARASIHHNSAICSEVKALCHHIATEAGQLSFNKGDILQVISKVDGDWLQCSLGSEKGLVPTMYVTHPEDEDY